MRRLFILLCMFTIGVIFMTHTATAQTSFTFPPKAYPAKVPFKCDAGVDSYWHVTSIVCTGRANGGYKFQIKGIAGKTSRSMTINLFYLMPGNRIQVAGAYFFPDIEEGKSFSFEIISAFSGYAPSKFNGFFISSEILQRKLLNEQRKAETPSNDTSDRQLGIPATEKAKPEQKPERISISSTKIYKSSEVDKEPAYPGGAVALLSDISKSIRYPKVCKDNGIEGRVLVGFVVEQDGSISDVTAVKRVQPNLNSEAERVVRSLRRWTPGSIQGQPVRVQMAVYVDFKL